jgi:hypothetical protein
MKLSGSRVLLVCLLLLLVARPAGNGAEAFLLRGPTGAESTRTPEVRLLCFGPSPYTLRHDSMRAGFGIYLLLQQAIRDHNLALSTSVYDAFPAVENADQGRALLRGAHVLVFGASTLAQGTPYHVRRFLELTYAEYLGGVSVTAWATSGGASTGGEMVIQDTLRSLMGMGAQAFTLGQKYMVFTTDERIDPPTAGEFALLDLWFMDQFARYIAVVALAGHDRAESAALSARLGVSQAYYRNFPRDVAALQQRYGALRHRLNAAASPNSDAWRDLTSLLTKY